MKTNQTQDEKTLQRQCEIDAHSEAMDAFDRAILQGRLSDNPQDASYAGKYMYMGREQKGDIGKDLFKNINSRQYDV